MSYNTWTHNGKALSPTQYKNSSFYYQGVPYNDYLREYNKLVAQGRLPGAKKAWSTRLKLENMFRLK